jgi:hypothetical protein
MFSQDGSEHPDEQESQDDVEIGCATTLITQSARGCDTLDTAARPEKSSGKVSRLLSKKNSYYRDGHDALDTSDRGSEENQNCVKAMLTLTAGSLAFLGLVVVLFAVVHVARFTVALWKMEDPGLPCGGSNAGLLPVVEAADDHPNIVDEVHDEVSVGDAALLRAFIVHMYGSVTETDAPPSDFEMREQRCRYGALWFFGLLTALCATASYVSCGVGSSGSAS